LELPEDAKSVVENFGKGPEILAAWKSEKVVEREY